MGTDTDDTNRVFERYQTEMSRLQADQLCQECLDRQRAGSRDGRAAI